MGGNDLFNDRNVQLSGMMNSDIIATEKTLERLKNVRHALLNLHKILMEYQRDLWERRNTRVESSYELLKLVMHDPEFGWLHQLSELVVHIDEMFDAPEPSTEADTNGLLLQARFLVSPSVAVDEFHRRYYEALQQSPDAVLAHAEVIKSLGRKISEVH